MMSPEFMAGWGWVLFSLIAAVFSAGFYLVNQYLRQPGHLLVFWMRVLVVLFMSPMMMHMQLPRDPWFYVTVLGTVFVGTFADIRSFNAAAKYGGGVVSRINPAIVWGAFLLWFIFDPKLVFSYIAHPWNTLGVLAALGGCVFFSMRLNRCPITREAIVYMAPALAGYALTTVLNKFAMGLESSAESAVYGYMYIQSFFACIFIGGSVLYRSAQGKDETLTGWANQKMLAAGLLACFTWICHMIYKNYGMVYTPNPSYLAALGLTTPVFIAIFYYFAKHKEEADVASGMGIVVCAVILALVTVR